MESLTENQAGQLSIQNLPAPRKTHPTARKPEEKENEKRLAEARKSYGRGKSIKPGSVKDRKLRSNLKRVESKYKDAILSAKDAEILLENQGGFLELEHELEKTYKVRQDEIQGAVSIQQAQKAFEFKLDLGPYMINYSRNGKDLLVAGRKGHISTCDWRAGKLGCELHLNELVRDAKWLHNNQYFVVAQKKHTYIYDHVGVEIHCLKQYVEATHLEFLPYHFLLAGIENSGFLRYTDTSTGQIVAEFPTRKGAPTALTQNPYNAILHAGHQNGTVSLWSPNSTAALVKIHAHGGPVRSVAVDRTGRYMLSGGQDQRLKLWDVRMYKEIHSYHTAHPASCISLSDRGLAAVSAGPATTIWKDLFTSSAPLTKTFPAPQKIQSPYLTHSTSSPTHTQFVPFEDLLGLGTPSGFSQIHVPGAGEPNFDSLSLNPYETVKQRQELEVQSLLQKLQSDTIALNPHFIGGLDVRSADQKARDKDLDREEVDVVAGAIKRDKERKKGRGKNSAVRKLLRKKGGKNVIDEKRMRLEGVMRERRERREGKAAGEREDLGVALGRFVRGNA